MQEQPLPASPGACSAPAVTPADAQGKARSRQAHVVPCSLNLSITKYFQRWRFPQPDVVYLDAKSSLVQVFTCHPLMAPKIPFLKGCAATHPLARRLAHPLATTWVNCSCVNLAATVIPKSSRAWHAPRPIPIPIPVPLLVPSLDPSILPCFFLYKPSWSFLLVPLFFPKKILINLLQSPNAFAPHPMMCASLPRQYPRD